MKTHHRCVGLLLNYRDAVRSASCIRSLMDNGITDVVVWDNSADGGSSAAQLVSQAGSDERFRVHVSPENLGFAAGVNRGLELCARLHPGAWVLLINNDARLLPGGLEVLAAALAARAKSMIAFPAINHSGVVRGVSYYHRPTGTLSSRPRPGCFAYPSGCCLLIATDRLDAPLLDEDFFMYGEDAALGWRLHGRPEALLFVDQVLVEHEGSASSGIGSAFYEAHMVAAHLILVRKLAGKGVDRGVLYLSRMLMLVARGLVRAARFRSCVPLVALWRGAKIAF